MHLPFCRLYMLNSFSPESFHFCWSISFITLFGQWIIYNRSQMWKYFICLFKVYSSARCSILIVVKYWKKFLSSSAAWKLEGKNVTYLRKECNILRRQNIFKNLITGGILSYVSTNRYKRLRNAYQERSAFANVWSQMGDHFEGDRSTLSINYCWRFPPPFFSIDLF